MYDLDVIGLRKVFYDLPTITVEGIIKNQLSILDSDVRAKVKYLPYTMHQLLERVTNLVENSFVTPKQVKLTQACFLTL